MHGVQHLLHLLLEKKKKETNTRRETTTIRTILDWIGFGAETRHSFVTRARSLHTTASSQRERDTIRSSSSKQKEIIYHRPQSSSSSSFFFFCIYKNKKNTARDRDGVAQEGEEAKVLYLEREKKDIYSTEKRARKRESYTVALALSLLLLLDCSQ